jgi:hypothetical protein
MKISNVLILYIYDCHLSMHVLHEHLLYIYMLKEIAAPTSPPFSSRRN